MDAKNLNMHAAVAGIQLTLVAICLALLVGSVPGVSVVILCLAGIGTGLVGVAIDTRRIVLEFTE